MKIRGNNFNKVCCVLYGIFILLNLVAVFLGYVDRVSYLILNIILLLGAGGFIFVMSKIKTVPKWVFPAVICIGIVLNFSLLLLHYKDPTLDYLTFFSNGVDLAKSGRITVPIWRQYLAMFPYLWGYIVFLGGLFKLVGASYMAVIVVHILLNFLSTFLIYQIVKRLADSRCAKVASCLWILSPINIMWSTISFGGTVFNTLLLITILATIYFLKQKKVHYLLLWAILLGLIIGLTNQFRPIMIIYIIALVIYVIWQKKEQMALNKGWLLGGTAIVLIGYLAVGWVSTYTLSKSIDLKVADSSIGWSLYTGADISTRGVYSKERAVELTEEWGKIPFDASKVQKVMQEKAIQSYKKNGLANIPFAIDKFFVLTERVGSYTAANFVDIVDNSFVAKNMNIFIAIGAWFWYILLMANMIFAYRFKGKKPSIISLLILFMGGFTIASLALEVSPRYYLPITAPLTICAAIALGKLLKKDTVKEETLLENN